MEQGGGERAERIVWVSSVVDFCRLVAGSEKTKKRANLWVDRNSNAPAANLPPSLRFGQYGDWFRGAAVFCWPVGVVYVGVAVLNQVVRRSGANKWIGPTSIAHFTTLSPGFCSTSLIVFMSRELIPTICLIFTLWA